jgi:hypothetical protein
MWYDHVDNIKVEALRVLILKVLDAQVHYCAHVS